MITRCSKSDFLTLVEQHVETADFHRVEDYIQFAEKNHLFRLNGESGDGLSEDEFFVYLYCSIKLLKFDINKFIKFLNDEAPFKTVTPAPSPYFKQEEFENLVRIRFGTQSAYVILSECEKIARESHNIPSERLYADFYQLLFVCGFQKDLFLRNLANHYILLPYIEKIREGNEAFKTFESLKKANDIEIELKKAVSILLPEYQRKLKTFSDGSTDFFAYKKITDVLSSDEFLKRLAWSIVDLFPESSISEYVRKKEVELNMLKEYKHITSFETAGATNVCKVTFKFGPVSQKGNEMTFSDPTITKQMGSYLSGYFRAIEAIPDENTISKGNDSYSANLKQRLVRRTALLFCAHGLFYGSEDNYKPEMWYRQNSQIVTVSFRTLYGSLIYDLLASVDKCKQALFFNQNDPKGNHGGNLTRAKDKWDVLKARVRNIPENCFDLKKDIDRGFVLDWQDSELSIDQILHLPFSLQD